MATLPKQDLPPVGGFDPINYKRNLPARGPPGWALFAGVAAFMAGGFYLLRVTSDEKYALKHEKLASRIALVPLLLAEEDEKYLKWKEATDKEEAELMKDRKDWKMHEKLYHTDKWQQPYVLTPRDSYPY